MANVPITTNSVRCWQKESQIENQPSAPLTPQITQKPMKIPGPAANPGASEGDDTRRFNAPKGTLGNPLIRAGLVLGMGFGGLADGIILHQILGWHHLVCYSLDCRPISVEQLQIENTQDGFFHLGLWLVLLVGTAMLFHAARHSGPAWSGRVLLGSMLSGCGLFNFVEGLVNHQILGIHHVLPGDPHQTLFDMLYLGNGLMFFIIGMRLIQSPRNSANWPTPSRHSIR
jgi:uncharacterized membrane protein